MVKKRSPLFQPLASGKLAPVEYGQVNPDPVERQVIKLPAALRATMSPLRRR